MYREHDPHKMIDRYMYIQAQVKTYEKIIFTLIAFFYIK